MSLRRSWHRQTPGGGGEGTPYNALYCDAPPEKAYFFQASGIERVAEVYERVGKSVIWSDKKAQEG